MPVIKTTGDIYYNNADSGDDTTNYNETVDVHQACVFGANAFGWAIGAFGDDPETALPLELRESGVLDFGRKRAIAWLAYWGFGIIEDNHIVIVETA